MSATITLISEIIYAPPANQSSNETVTNTTTTNLTPLVNLAHSVLGRE